MYFSLHNLINDNIMIMTVLKAITTGSHRNLNITSHYMINRGGAFDTCESSYLWSLRWGLHPLLCDETNEGISFWGAPDTNGGSSPCLNLCKTSLI